MSEFLVIGAVMIGSLCDSTDPRPYPRAVLANFYYWITKTSNFDTCYRYRARKRPRVPKAISTETHRFDFFTHGGTTINQGTGTDVLFWNKEVEVVRQHCNRAEPSQCHPKRGVCKISFPTCETSRARYEGITAILRKPVGHGRLSAWNGVCWEPLLPESVRRCQLSCYLHAPIITLSTWNERR